jgi:arsenate reductase
VLRCRRGIERTVIVNAQIGVATPDDVPAVLALLEHNHLPVDGLREHIATTLVARRDGRIVGSAALEPYADGVLLRSVAVAPELQRQGVGYELTSAALRFATELRAPAVYLLTTTAERYFPRFGFERIGRGEVPASVQTSVEFTSACPASAVVMRLRLRAPKRVIFACVHNAGRSQMAAAFFDTFADPSKAEAVSAGTEPADRVHPAVVEVMRELGVDVSRRTPQRLTDQLAAGASLLITMGCGESCPYVPGLERDDWPLSDPKDQPLTEVRRIRDEIRERVLRLVELRQWKRAGAARERSG